MIGFNVRSLRLVGALLGIVAVLFWFSPSSTPLVAASPQTLDAPANIACLPFPQPTITEYNGNTISGPYTSDADQTIITWRDESDSETDYEVQNRIGNGSWTTIATLPADSTSYTHTGLETNNNYTYRVRALEDDTAGAWSAVCRKPSFLDSSDGNFRIFYRPYAGDGHCPDVEDLDGDAETMCSTQSTAQRMADILDASYAWIIDYGFPDPVPSPPMAVDLTLCDGNGCARSSNGTQFIGLRPLTMANAFDLATASNESSLRAPRHELFHMAQQGVKQGGDGQWISEGTARSTDDKYCLDEPTCDLSLDTFPGSWYMGDAEDFLLSPNRTLFESGYNAALFWTYISEQYGTLNQEPERGIDFFAQFWASGQANPHTHGREVIDFTLGDMGYDETFEDVFKAFVVANYAKDLSNAPANYRYTDESESTGSYGSVARTEDRSLGVGDSYFSPSEDGNVVAWGARYFRFVPDAAVPSLDIQVNPLLNNKIYVAVLAIKNGTIVEEINETTTEFNDSIANNALDEVVVVVAGLEEDTNFNLVVNATSPILRIVDPLSSRRALAGDPAAPEKILVKVEVLAPEGGAPIAGVDPASFELSVGGVAIPENQVISSAYIQGEYWLLVRAPVQPGPGTYALLVENDTIAGGTTLSDTQASSVEYGAAIESDNLIVGDRSGSMADFEKLEAAQDAARLYVDSWDTGDQLGVISYNEAATVDLPLQAWTTNSRDDAFDEINDWEAGGETGIGVALLEGLTQFDDEGDSSHPWNMILLSDGMETVDEPNLQDFIDTYTARVDDGDQVPTVHVVALGANADQSAMQQLANDTGGTYHFAGADAALLAGGNAEPLLNNSLAEIYRVVSEKILLEQQIYSAQDFLPVGLRVHTHRILVDGSASEAIFAINWVQTDNSAPVGVTLRRPDNTIVLQRRGDANHYLYRVPLPMQGEWTITIAYEPPGLNAGEGEPGGFHYLVEAALRSDLTMDVYLGLAPEERLVGRAMPILVSLSDVAPLTGATMIGNITTPSGAPYSLTLYDDGLHGDGAANDGFYGSNFHQTWQPGSYQLVVDADGNSPLHGAFNRRVLTSFYMDGGQDSDGDRLPDHWEEENGTDPETPDPRASDPDRDGLTTYTEFTIGTHPLDPDTDNGGENDGSEVRRGTIPQDYPRDDGVVAPDSVGWAGAGRLWLTYPARPDYNHLRIYRAVGPRGSWTLVAEEAPPNGQWMDPNVTNGTEYCYDIQAVSVRGAESGTTNIVCLIPKLDPIAPEGEVSINDGAGTTAQLQVSLRLRASDAASDAHLENAEQPPVAEGAQTSGVAEMMISNRADFAGASWEPYAPTKSWTLAPRGGGARVFVRFRDAAGNISEPTRDSILLSEALNLYLPLLLRN